MRAALNSWEIVTSIFAFLAVSSSLT